MTDADEREALAESAFYAMRRDDWGAANNNERDEFLEAAESLLASDWLAARERAAERRGSLNALIDAAEAMEAAPGTERKGRDVVLSEAGWLRARAEQHREDRGNE